MKEGYYKIPGGPKVGDTYTMKRDLFSHAGTFVKGAKVTIIEEDDRRGYTITDKNGNTLTQVGWDI